MAAALARNPHVVQRAKDLGLRYHGDCLAAVRAHAVRQVEAVLGDLPIPCDTLDVLQRLVAMRCGLKVELVESDAAVDRIADEHRDFHPFLRERLACEFVAGGTEGITLQRDPLDPPRFRFLAVVDARGARAVRAYFTAWHEVVHLLTHPEQRPFPDVRRAPAPHEVAKEPLESLVDHVAGRLAFYPPLFGPVLRAAVADHGGLTFAAIEAARARAAPAASLFAAAIGAMHLAPDPTLLVSAEVAPKAADRRFARGAQHLLALDGLEVREDLRVPSIAANDAAAASALAIRRNMRVPARSVIARVYESPVDVSLAAVEDQAWWETSRNGPLPAARIRIAAVRRGRFVYGLISPVPQPARQASTRL